MRMLDVNVLLYAYREDAPNHARFKQWLEELLSSEQTYAVSDFVLSAVLRIATHPRVFNPPSPFGSVAAFVERVRGRPNCAILMPGPRHWDIFLSLCRSAKVRGNLVPDAFLAALAIETGSEWITTDRDYARFPGLSWRHPLEPPT
jgi:toxin-antitoxin system PIN domain toxin